METLIQPDKKPRIDDTGPDEVAALGPLSAAAPEGVMVNRKAGSLGPARAPFTRGRNSKTRRAVANNVEANDDPAAWAFIKNLSTIEAAYLEGAQLATLHLEAVVTPISLGNVLSAELAALFAIGPDDQVWWTDDDEARLARDWEAEAAIQGSLHQRLLALTEAQVSVVRPFWKLFIKVYRRLPTDIFTEKTRLVVAARNSWDAHLPGAPFWSQGFYTFLGKIACHPLFQGNLDILVLVLQFVAIAATGDKGTWRFQNPT